LPNPELFTGHCFGRTGATILADAGGDTLTVKNFGGWKSTQVMETYVEELLDKKEKIGNTILISIRNSKVPIIQSIIYIYIIYIEQSSIWNYIAFNFYARLHISSIYS
jgi:hypothetical protein